MKGENHQRERHLQKPTKRVLLSRELGLGLVMVVMKKMMVTGVKLKMVMGVLNWFMTRFPHGMFNPNPLHGMICGRFMVQKMCNALLFDRCALERNDEHEGNPGDDNIEKTPVATKKDED